MSKGRKNSKKPIYNVKSRVISALRNMSRFSPMKQALLDDAKIHIASTSDNGKKKIAFQYRCNECKLSFVKSLVVVDHIKPIIPTNSSPLMFDFNSFIHNLNYGFLTYTHTAGDLEKLKERGQVLCLECSAIKTGIENAERAYYKNLYKNVPKEIKQEHYAQMVREAIAARLAEAHTKRKEAIENYRIKNPTKRPEIDLIELANSLSTETEFKKLEENIRIEDLELIKQLAKNIKEAVKENLSNDDKTTKKTKRTKETKKDKVESDTPKLHRKPKKKKKSLPRTGKKSKSKKV